MFAAMADRSQLPEVLARPPWKRPKKERPTVPRRDGIALADYPSSSDLPPERAQERRPEVEKRFESPGPDARLMLLDLRHCSDEVALRAFTELPVEVWVYTNVDHVRHVLARFGAEVFPALVAYGALHPDHLAELVIHVDAPHPALLCALWVSRGTALAAPGRAWLSAHPEAAAVGLIPSVLGEPGKERAAAESALRIVQANDEGAVAAACARYGEAVARDVRAIVETPPIWSFPAKVPKLPKWWSASALPEVRLRDGTPLGEDAIDAIGTMLRFTSIELPYPGLADVRDACDPRSLDELAWGIVELWVGAGASANAYWALYAVAHLGADYATGQLARAITVWPRERGLARAKLGCDVLVRIGSDAALARLDRISRTVRKAALRRHAEAAIEEVARRRGLSRDDLDDRLVPDLGLDADGTATLDLGSRILAVRFDAELTPYLTDEEGQRLARLSKKKTDDPELAKSASKRWKALRKDAAAVIDGQVRRLERRMVEQKSWPLPTFRTLFLDHPLVSHLARRLLFRCDDGAGSSVFFRVTDDDELLDANDDPAPAEGAPIAIAHPLLLDAEAKKRWSEVFSDYEIVQPFPQLAREVHHLDEGDRGRRDLPERSGRPVWTKVLFGLESRGWKQGAIEEGWLRSFYKSLGRRHTVQLRFQPGMYVADPKREEAQTIEHVRLLQKGTFGELDPIAFSELVRDLDSLTGPDG